MYKQSGFTLIELMIVVVIVGILVTIAYPSYTSFVQKSRRGDAIASLADFRVEQEKWRANNISYTTSAADLGLSGSSKDGYYDMTIVSAGASTYQVTAAPTGVQSSDSCNTFSIDENGPDYSGGYADADCWER
ncbi:prepilin-type N-terminal cleavage/methylation domain-containing protein (plasmid) [Amphritea atlantica]|uniref:Prepilin-type N-terminal cleavage/methylation domain-containing protein n=1 Tax=Amphritea atlantica TaxID=355243 RepID=A0ABY5H053_9GAMM|nr:prepilin-type N-terminal cleavage/methylation domain-containing protein [Amphritea atlantica]